MFSEHNEIIEFVHDRFVSVSSQADCCGLSRSTLTRCMSGARGLGAVAWGVYRRWLYSEFAWKFCPSPDELCNGWRAMFDSPTAELWDGWNVFAFPAPDKVLVIYEYCGQVVQVQYKDVPKMQALKQTFVELNMLVQTTVREALVDDSTGAIANA